MIHKPLDRHFTVLGGAVKTSGRSLQLANGQIGLFRTDDTTKDGILAVSTVLGAPKNRQYQIRVGSAPLGVTRSQSSKSWSTFPFTLGDVLDVKVSAPDSTEQGVDEVIVGYNGIDADTSISFPKKGQRRSIYLKLSGEYIGMLGYPNNEVTVEYAMESTPCDPTNTCEECDECTETDCATIVLDAVEFLKSYELRGGIKVSDAVDITPVKSCATSPTYVDVDYTFQTLTICDTGDDNALAIVQAQYPDYTITRKNRVGSNSTYELLAVDGAVITDFEEQIASILKGCDTCPAGYTASPDGILYAITIDDAGDSATAITAIELLPGADTATGTFQGRSNNIGTYTVIVDDELTEAEIAAFVATNDTATVEKVGVVSVFCDADGAGTTTAWVDGDTCTLSNETYEITLPDNECGQTRLAELQAAFPSLTIVKKGTSTQTVNLAGASGTGNIIVNGVSYLSTFNTDIATTEQDFVTARAAAILAATGAVVTYAGGLIVFTDNTLGFPTITFTNATGNLAGTIGTLTEATDVQGGCQTVYQKTVTTNLTCDECDPIYRDVYTSEAPAPYENIKWEAVANATSYTNCLCGIRFKGKETFIYPDEAFRDSFGFTNSSVQIEASGGFITEVREGIGQIVDEPFKVTYLSRWSPKTHLGGNLWQYEDESRMFFTGQQRHTDLTARLLSGEYSKLEAGKQYIDYAITIRRSQYAQSMSDTHSAVNTYHILVESGLHQNVETMVNLIAGGAGLAGVTA